MHEIKQTLVLGSFCNGRGKLPSPRPQSEVGQEIQHRHKVKQLGS